MPRRSAPAAYFSPVGMRSRAGTNFAMRPRPLATMSYDELLDAHVRRELGIGHLLLEAQESRMDHPTIMRSIELMGAKVIPALATCNERYFATYAFAC